MIHAVDRNALEPSWLRGGRIPSLDGLRAVAVLLVLLAHAHQTRGFPQSRAVAAIGLRGSLGVDVFFVISGFLITTLMLRERARTGRLDVGRFYLRRILRIVPAYACLLLVVAAMQAAGLAAMTRRDWVAALTYTVNFLRYPAWEVGHAWSLSIEEHFYLLWPLLMAAAPRWGLKASLACLAACFAARWVVMLRFPASSPMVELWTFTRLDAIATGCVLAFLARDAAWRGRLDRLGSADRFVVAALVTLAVSLTASAYSAKFKLGLAYTVNQACIAVLIWAAISRGGSAVGRVLNHRVPAAIGVASYSLYLWQQIFLNPHSERAFCTFPLNLALAAIAATLSYRVVERPFVRLKQRVEPRDDGAALRRGLDAAAPEPGPGKALTVGQA